MAGPMNPAQGGLDAAGVAVHQVSKYFARGETRSVVLDKVSLRIDKGEFVSLIGPSGCGKSTLLKVIAGLLDADGGSVVINGRSVREASRRKAIGLVPQSPALLPWRTIVDNVRLPVNINPKANAGRDLRDPEALLAGFGLGAALDLYPAQLSVGMRQRAAIARAFAFDPDILLMDEPFSALDEINRDQQRLKLLEVWQSNQKSVLFVTHSVPEAIILSDRIVVMGARGHIAGSIAVNLPRPRDEAMYASDGFRDLEGHVRNTLRQVMGAAHAG